MKIAEGRMIRKSISESKNFARLSPKAQVLFTMLIPHFNAHGKMNGGTGFVKDVVCPRVNHLSPRMIPRLLAEISRVTAVKWFKVRGRWWIHSLNFNSKHQKLKSDRLGDDNLPSYPGLKRDYSGLIPDNTGVCPPEVEGKGKEEEEVIDKHTTPNPMRGGSRANSSKQNGGPRLIKASIKEHLADVLKRNS